jgi:ATP synthase subunit 6
MFPSALEQFQIYPIVKSVCYVISITNQIIMFLVLWACLMYIHSIFKYTKTLGYLIPGRFQLLLENIYITSVNIFYENTEKRAIKFFPYIFAVCFFILVSNLLGLVPYSFTITSHLFVTLFLSLSLFGGITYVIYKLHGLKSLQLFLPKGTSFFLAFLLIPIEIVSFIFKPLSLGVRLFANLIAGHTLLKVIAGFSWAIILQGGLIFGFHIVPLIILVLLIGLEVGVGLIQSYVFLILTCIYFRDAIKLH